MADISMCQDAQGPSREECYRFTAIPNECRQSYMDFASYRDGQDCCESFIPNENCQTKTVRG